MALSIIHWLAIVGFILSVYFLYVKVKTNKDKKYKAFCDISESVSCSTAAKSKYSTVFILPNSLMGIFFYVTIFVVAFFSMTYVFYLAAVSAVVTLYLVYASFKIKNACILCILVYIINFLLFYFSL